MPSLTSMIYPAFLVAANLASALPTDVISESNIVNIRIEGADNTIYEAPIYSGPRNVTTASGGTHLCDGTNDGANPTPSNTCTDALDASTKLIGQTFDGTYDPEFQDFFITRISTSQETATEFWGLLLNYQFTPVGGCQQEVKPGDNVLWAYNAFSFNYFLKVTPNTIAAKKGSSHTVTVTDGTTGVVIPNAIIDGVTTDADGNAILTFPNDGVFEYKATRSDSLRSNALYVAVA
ncbi:hypothetical protein MMC28_009298 [Mycoblastus sanguinarius]|nr:hypothetical protein [Mycoblastus sanguinarius]